MRKETIVDGVWYHVYNRGVNKMTIFHSDQDYHRFLKRIEEYKTQYNIHILAWSLMPNHFHFLIKGGEMISKAKPLGKNNVPNNLSSFLHKIKTSYTMYYHTKYEYLGPVFQGPFKAKPVETEEYLITLLHYIHRQPSHHSHQGLASKEAKPLDHDWPYTSLHDYFLRSSPLFRITDIDESLLDIHDYPRLFASYKEELQTAWTFEN